MFDCEPSSPDAPAHVNEKLTQLARELRQVFREENEANAALREHELSMSAVIPDHPKGAELEKALAEKKTISKACKSEFWSAHGLAATFELTLYGSWQPYASRR